MLYREWTFVNEHVVEMSVFEKCGCFILIGLILSYHTLFFKIKKRYKVVALTGLGSDFVWLVSWMRAHADLHVPPNSTLHQK